MVLCVCNIPTKELGFPWTQLSCNLYLTTRIRPPRFLRERISALDFGPGQNPEKSCPSHLGVRKRQYVPDSFLSLPRITTRIKSKVKPACCTALCSELFMVFSINIKHLLSQCISQYKLFVIINQYLCWCLIRCNINCRARRLNISLVWETINKLFLLRAFPAR